MPAPRWALVVLVVEAASGGGCTGSSAGLGRSSAGGFGWVAGPVSARRCASARRQPFFMPRTRRTQHWLADRAALEWTAAERNALERAIRRRAYGQAREAADMVARHVVFPSELQSTHVAQAVRLDVGLWYRAYTGQQWDGGAATLQAARASARRRHWAQSAGGATASAGAGRRTYGVFRCSHLLVNALDRTRVSDEEVDDFTEFVGWPAAQWCGTLEWQNEQALACAFCDAMLLPSEALPVENAVGAVRGRHCCQRGCAHAAIAAVVRCSVLCPFPHCVCSSDSSVACVIGKYVLPRSRSGHNG